MMLQPFYVAVPIVYYTVSFQDCNNGISYPYKQYSVSFQGWQNKEEWSWKLTVYILFKIKTAEINTICAFHDKQLGYSSVIFFFK